MEGNTKKLHMLLVVNLSKVIKKVMDAKNINTIIVIKSLETKSKTRQHIFNRLLRIFDIHSDIFVGCG